MRLLLLIAAGSALTVALPATPPVGPVAPGGDPPEAVASPGDRSPVWRAPLDPLRLRSPYDPPADDWLSGHRGVDLAGRIGDPVRAVAAGTVTWAGPIADRGVVSIRHGGLQSTYEPIAPSVSVGEQVTTGTVLGRLASGGHCPGCLHLGARTADGYRDPWPLLTPGIRLLPTRDRRGRRGEVSRWRSATASAAGVTGSRCRSACSRGP